MTGAPDHHDATREPGEGARETIRYPSNHVSTSRQGHATTR